MPGLPAQAGGGGETDPAALAGARRLLAAMRYEQLLLAGLETGFEKMNEGDDGKAPQVFMDSLKARVQRDAPAFIDSIAQLYARRHTAADLAAVAEFFESPIGQRYTAAQPEVELETSKLAERWGIGLALEVMRDLFAKGLITEFPK